MKIEEFTLERQQSIWEGKVKYNLSESGVHPGSIKSLFDSEMIDIIENTELTYGYTEGSPELRSVISKIYKGSKPDNIQVYNGSSEANFVALMTLIEPNDERTITDQPSVVRKGVSPVDENIANDGLQGHASNRRHITN